MNATGNGWLVAGGLLLIAVAVTTAIASRQHLQEPPTDTEPAAEPAVEPIIEREPAASGS
jgi:small neutral amino acid transporter SnatA (MarC family)